jgi:zinc protease
MTAGHTVAPLRLPPLTEETLENGLTVITAHRTDLPLVALRLVIRSGAAYDPPGREGLAGLTGVMLRRGAGRRTADQIDDAIESIGGLMGVDVGYEATSIAVTVPSEHLETAVAVVSELAQRPLFPPKAFGLEKRRELAQLQQDFDDPSGVADRALSQFYFGKKHPFGHSPEGRLSSVRRLTRLDSVRFHRETYGPDRAILFVVGDVDPSAAAQLARKALGKWRGRSTTPLSIALPPTPVGTEVMLVDKPDATQAQVRLAAPGLPRKDPDYYAAVVANTILGGGFTSRLVDEVRVNRGLSYSVSTRLAAMRLFGSINYSTFTRSETVKDILDVSLNVLSTFHDAGPKPEEVEKAKRYVIGLYPGRVESVDQLAEALASARLLDLPFSSIEEYREQVDNVTPEAAASVAKRFPTRAAAKIVVVGSAKKIRSQLDGFENVSVVRMKSFE